MNITAEDIKKAIEFEDDFGHEMRVGGILKNFQANASSFQFQRSLITPPSHGGTYQDPKTEKTRQFDYRCKIVSGHQSQKTVLLPVECKNLKAECPLVICGRDRDIQESYHHYIAKDRNGNPSILKVEQGASFYKPNSFAGKSISRLKRNQKNELADVGDSDVYDSWSQALASSHDLVKDAIFAESETSVWSFIMPLVVVPNESLWIADYNDEGIIIDGPKPINQCSYYVDQRMMFEMPLGMSLQTRLDFQITHIHFATMLGLVEILTQFANSDSHCWDAIFNSHAATLVKSKSP